jgi:PKD repeat protein
MDYLMIKVDPEGNEVWSHTFGGSGSDIGAALCYSSSGGYFLCGYSNSYGAGEDDIYIIKTDASGNELWSQTYGSVKSETAHDIEVTSDGNLIIAGSTGIYDIPGGAGHNRDMYFLKIDEEGNVLAENEVWIITAQQGSYDMCYSVLPTPDGGFYALGNSSCEGNEVMDISLLRLNSMLEEEWNTTYEIATIYDFGYAVGGIIDDNYLYITGNYYSTQFCGSSIYFKLLDLEGNEISAEEFDLEGPASAYDICQTETGDFLITGHCRAEDGSQDLLQLHVSGLIANFSSTAETGHYPLTITFQDETNGSPISWNWDFENDGVIDSQEQNPVHTYSEPGIYSVRLVVFDPYLSQEIVKEGYVRVFDGESALEFDGTNSYVTIPAEGTIDLTSTLTLEAWIYPYTWGETPAFGGRILDKDSYAIYLCENHNSLTDHSLGLQLKTETTPFSLSVSEDNSILLNSWQHVAVSYDGIDKVMIHINGQPSAVTQLNAPVGTLLDNSATDLILGKSSNLSWAFNGIIDEVRIWNTVRSQQEILDNMYSCLQGTETGLAAYWNMNDGWGEMIMDCGENSNNGMLHDVRWIQGTPFEPTETEDEMLPDNCGIYNLTNFPNPFNPTTTITFYISNEQIEPDEHIELCVYNIKGQLVKELTSAVTLSRIEDAFINNASGPSTPVYTPLRLGRPLRMTRAGSHKYSVTWNGTDNYGNPVPSGIYFYKISANGSSTSRKMLLLK